MGDRLEDEDDVLSDSAMMQLVEAKLESDKLDRIADYVSRGRRFGGLDIDDLRKRADGALAELSAAPRNPEKFQLHDDLCSELMLRDQDPPIPTVTQLQPIIEEAQRALDDPRVQKMSGDQIERFVRSLTDPKSKN